MKKIFFCLAVVFLFVSCASVQKDLAVSVEDTMASEEILDFELRLVAIDGKYYASSPSSISNNDSQELKRLCADIDKSLSVPLLDKVSESHLLSLKGRALLLLGNKTEAKKQYENARKKFENGSQCLILARRLGEVNISTSQKYKTEACLTIEAALEKFDDGEYDVAAGLFDEAFLNSNSFYRDAYLNIRDWAWQIRDINLSNENTNLLKLSSITLLQMMEITQNETNLLDYYNGGKKVSSKQLFQFLNNAGLLESCSINLDETPAKKNLSENTATTRILCTRFLWNIFTTKKNVDSKKYSTRYRSRANAKSPVDDVPLSSEDFDAVLGTVENEIMALVDGKNFNPDGNVSAIEFNNYLSNILKN